jgi:hypothetical protein
MAYWSDIGVPPEIFRSGGIFYGNEASGRTRRPQNRQVLEAFASGRVSRIAAAKRRRWLCDPGPVTPV